MNKIEQYTWEVKRVAPIGRDKCERAWHGSCQCLKKEDAQQERGNPHHHPSPFGHRDGNMRGSDTILGVAKLGM